MSRNFSANLIDGTYEGVDPEYECLDLSRQELTLEGIKLLMLDVAVDTAVLHLNINYNVTLEETRDAKKFTLFVNHFIDHLEKNKTLTALDIAGNYLGLTTPHPKTPHTLEYISMISKSLAKTKITHLNISDNVLLGSAGQLYKPFSELIKNYVSEHCKVFRCNDNRLHSQAFKLISEALTHKSLLVHLDLSDNIGGVDPTGRPNSEGISALTTMIGQCRTLRVLKLANNRLRDEDIVSIADSLLALPYLRTLDISGNACAVFGAEAIHRSIQGHAALKSHTEGLHCLDMSRIALAPESARHIALALGVSDSLKYVGLSDCSLTTSSLALLRDCLQDNLELMLIDLERNNGSEDIVTEIEAEVVTNNVLVQIRSDPMDVDVLVYPEQVHNALRRKLKTLPERLLRLLHGNPSFGESSPLHEELHRLTPPLRRQLFHRELSKNSDIRSRLDKSTKLGSEMDAILLIYRVVNRWHNRLKLKRKLMRANLRAKA